ncbi:MAG: transposase [Coleofasciculaceae cyanobacterium]
MASVNIYGSVDAVTFEAFIRQKLIPHLQENADIIMDNAKIHQGEMVKELLEKAGAKLLYLSPYSPEFSTIENLWSKVKAILKKTAARTYKELIDGREDAMLQVTQANIRNWFTHCYYCAS